ncbi:hypothetical protein ADUPG1_005445, partial [Aduncisulcus paluster]
VQRAVEKICDCRSEGVVVVARNHVARARNVDSLGVRYDFEELLDRLLRRHVGVNAANEKRWCSHAAGPFDEKVAYGAEFFGTSCWVALQELEVGSYERRIPSPDP